MGLTDRIRSLLGKLPTTPSTPEAKSVDATLRESGQSTSSTAPKNRPLRRTLADTKRPAMKGEVKTPADSGDEKGASLREQIRRSREREAIKSNPIEVPADPADSKKDKLLKEGRAAARVASVADADTETDRMIYEAAVRRADELLAARQRDAELGADPNAEAYKLTDPRAEELERARQASAPGRRARLRSQFLKRGTESDRVVQARTKDGKTKTVKVPNGMGFLVEEGLVDPPPAGERARMRRETPAKQPELMPGKQSVFSGSRGRHTPDQMADLAMRLIDAGVPEARAADATFELLDAIGQTHTYRDPSYLSDPDSAVLKPGVLQPGERKFTVPSATAGLNQPGATAMPEGGSVPVSPMASDDDVDQVFNGILEKYGARSRLPSRDEMNATLESTLRDDPIYEGPGNQKAQQFGRPDNPLKGLTDDPEDMSPQSLSDYQYSSDFLKALQQFANKNKAPSAPASDNSLRGGVESVGPLAKHVAAVRDAMKFGDESPAGRLRGLMLARMTAEDTGSGGVAFRSGSLPNRIQLRQVIGGDLDQAMRDLAEQVGTDPSLEAIAPKLAESLQMNMEATKGRFVDTQASRPGGLTGSNTKIRTLAESGVAYDPTAKPYEDVYRQQDGSETQFDALDDQGNPRYVPAPELSNEPTPGAPIAGRKSLRESMVSLLNDVRSGFRESSTSESGRTDAAPQGPKPGDPIKESRKGLFIQDGEGRQKELIKLVRKGSTSQTKKQVQDWKAYLPLEDGRFLEYTVNGSDGTVLSRDDVQRMVNSGYDVAPGQAAESQAFAREADLTQEEAFRAGRILREYYRGGGNATDAARALAQIDRLGSDTAPAGLKDVAFQAMDLPEGEASVVLDEIRSNVAQIQEAAGGSWWRKGASVDGPPTPDMVFKQTPEGKEAAKILKEREDSGQVVDGAMRAQVAREVLLKSFNASPEETADPARALRNVLSRLDAQGIPLGNDTLIHQLAAFTNIAPEQIRAPVDDLEKLAYAAMLKNAHASAPADVVERVLDSEGVAARSWNRTFGGSARQSSPMSENIDDPAPSVAKGDRMLAQDADVEADAAGLEQTFLDAINPENLEDGTIGVQPTKNRQAPPRPSATVGRDRHLEAVRALFQNVTEAGPDGTVTTSKNPVPLGFQVAEGRFQQRPSIGPLDEAAAAARAVRDVDLSDPDLAIGSMQSEIDALRDSILAKVEISPERAEEIAGDIEQAYSGRMSGSESGFPPSDNELRRLKKRMVKATEKAFAEERQAMAEDLIATGGDSDPDVARLREAEKKLSDFQESLTRVTGADYKTRVTAGDAQSSLMGRLFDSTGADKQSDASVGGVGEMLPGQEEIALKGGKKVGVSKLPKREPRANSMDRAELGDIVERLYGGKFAPADNIKAVAAEMHRRGLLESPEDYETVIYDSLARNGTIAGNYPETALRDAAWQVADHLGLKRSDATSQPDNRVTDETIARGMKLTQRPQPPAPPAPKPTFLQRLLGQQPAAPEAPVVQDFSGLVSDAESSVPDWEQRLRPFDATAPRRPFENLDDLPEPVPQSQLQAESGRLKRLADSLESQADSSSDIDAQARERILAVVDNIRNRQLPALDAARQRVAPDIKKPAPLGPVDRPAGTAPVFLAPEGQVPGAMYDPIVAATEDIPGVPKDFDKLLAGGARPHFTTAAEARRLIEAQRGNVYDAATRYENQARLTKSAEAIESMQAEMEDITANGGAGTERMLQLAQKKLDGMLAEHAKLQTVVAIQAKPTGAFDPGANFTMEDLDGSTRFAADRVYQNEDRATSMTSRYSYDMPYATTAEELAEIGDDLDHVVMVGPDREYAQSYASDLLRAFASANGADVSALDPRAAAAGAALRNKVALANPSASEMALIQRLVGGMGIKPGASGSLNVDANAPLDFLVQAISQDPKIQKMVASLPPEQRIAILEANIADSPLSTLETDSPYVSAALAIAPRYGATTLRELSHVIGGHLAEEIGSAPVRQRVIGVYKGRPELRSPDADMAADLDLDTGDAAPRARWPQMGTPARTADIDDPPLPAYDAASARSAVEASQRQLDRARRVPARPADPEMSVSPFEELPMPERTRSVGDQPLASGAQQRPARPAAAESAPAQPQQPQGPAAPRRSRIADLASRAKLPLVAVASAGLGSYAARMNGAGGGDQGEGDSDYMRALSEMGAKAAAEYQAGQLASAPEMDTNSEMALAPAGAAGEEMLASAGTQAASPAAVLSRIAEARRARPSYLTSQNPFPY